MQNLLESLKYFVKRGTYIEGLMRIVSRWWYRLKMEDLQIGNSWKIEEIMNSAIISLKNILLLGICEYT